MTVLHAELRTVFLNLASARRTFLLCSLLKMMTYIFENALSSSDMKEMFIAGYKKYYLFSNFIMTDGIGI